VRIPGRSKTRRAIAGVVAGLLVFVMLFTVGTGFFIYQAVLSNQYNVANANNQELLKQKASEQLTLVTSCTSPCSSIGVTVTNTGGVALVVTGAFMQDQNNALLCMNPMSASSPVGACALSPVPPSSGLPLNVGVEEVFSIGAGVTVTCTNTKPCLVGFVTQRGNEFTQAYPNPAPATPAVITQVQPSSSVTAGESVYDTASLVGATATAGGMLTYDFFSTSSCSGIPSSTFQVTVTNGNVPPSNSPSATPPSTTVTLNAGYYSWDAVYSGDSGNQGPDTSPCEPLTVAPSLITTLSSNVVKQGSQVSDTATLSGGTAPTGTIQFYEGNAQQCTGNPPLGSPVTVTGNGAYPSPTPNPTFGTSGAFYWYAEYSGDLNNPPVSSSCEVLLVNNPSGVTNANPTLSTTLSSSSVKAGTIVTDTATLLGGTGPTGAIVFEVFFGSCLGPMVYASNPIPVGGNSGGGNSPPQYMSSPGFAPTLVGSYYWEAFYLGDNFNNPTNSGCGSEVLTVSKATPTLSTSLSSSNIVAGQSAFDTATLSSASGAAGGTVSYYTYSNAICTIGSKTVNTVPVSNGQVPSSTYSGVNPVVYKNVGNFSWNAIYSGDSNNQGPIASPCEPVTVVSATSFSCSGVSCFPTSNAFGFIAMNFSYFQSYSGACTQSGNNPVKGCSFTVAFNPSLNSQSGYLVDSLSFTSGKFALFVLQLTNIDVNLRQITLVAPTVNPSSSAAPDGTTLAQFSAPNTGTGGGKTTANPFILVGAVCWPTSGTTCGAYTKGQIMPAPVSLPACGSSVCLPTYVVFASPATWTGNCGGNGYWGSACPLVVANFLFLYGQDGTLIFGQNIPFTVTRYAS
jgi:hypothetical protein